MPTEPHGRPTNEQLRSVTRSKLIQHSWSLAPVSLTSKRPEVDGTSHLRIQP
ncbi:hypothetical protein DPMN_085671 [Dreissena polymorpha]|uniref:Uncharacterized protein n=1 Tax=Dreissena polymorpha TaxID=45954 RepID=A0A9D4BKH4_DREPO|nr:hypothetical protein DPMN_085671 [Dreissena polymorpha]